MQGCSSSSNKRLRRAPSCPGNSGCLPFPQLSPTSAGAPQLLSARLGQRGLGREGTRRMGMTPWLDRRQQGGLVGRSDTSQAGPQLQGRPHPISSHPASHPAPQPVLHPLLHPALHPASHTASRVASCSASCSASHVASCIPRRSPCSSRGSGSRCKRSLRKFPVPSKVQSCLAEGGKSGMAQGAAVLGLFIHRAALSCIYRAGVGNILQLRRS